MDDASIVAPPRARREVPSHGVSLREAFGVWTRVALLSFGGPAGQIAVMHRILVEEKRWIGEHRFLHALNYCMLLPGPEAQQLATYIGWLMHRTRGGLIAGGLFILPGIVAIMALSWIYALFGKVGIVSALFFGLKAAVLAIVFEALVRIGRRSLKNRVMLGLGRGDVFGQIAIFFSKMAMVTFGGAYAVLAYVAQQAVEHYGWLRPGEMLDGLGMAETTPGPLIMVLQFVGFTAAFRDPGILPPLVAGTLGGLLATWVTFTPCFLWIFVGAPFIEVLRDNKALSGALSAITAAVVGVILNLAIWFAIHTIITQVHPVAWGPVQFDAPVFQSVNIWAFLLSVVAVIAMFRFKVGMVPTLAATSAAGIVLYLLGAIS
ncbi:chromate transporter [Microvirga sp. M2]|uniref:chromate transporter n=1 Tax=Microvirga sp. M2 TaxID=3073270 RepID=UPI0039C17E3C